MPRNPIWTRDELILALELYFRVNPVRISAEHPEVLRLSVLLNELPIHTERPDEVRFRNPNGVYMKLCNFLRFDPNYEGIGLNRGGRLEREIWTEFAHDRARLIATARSIQAALRVVSSQEVVAELSSCDEEFPEGRLLTAVHRIRERNVSVVQRKKESVLAATGALECEACGFDFERTYRSLGSLDSLSATILFRSPNSLEQLQPDLVIWQSCVQIAIVLFTDRGPCCQWLS